MLIHCQGDPEVIVRRYRERAERGERHPGHHDLQLVKTVGQALSTGEYEPVDLNVPTLRVDTTISPAGASACPGDYAPAYERVVDFIRSARTILQARRPSGIT
jgi:hypothetical protein